MIDTKNTVLSELKMRCSTRKTSARLSTGLFLLGVLFLTGCSTVGGDPSAHDPWQTTNRKLFKVDRAIDKAIIKPVAKGYRKVVPDGGRRSVRHFVDNLHAPVVFANDVLQFQPKRAGITLSRFIINSTFGLAGFFDPAKKIGLPQHEEDFGQTLAVYGVPEGPYVYLPVLGPLPPRDMVGFLVDIITNPLFWMGDAYASHVNQGRVVADGVGKRERVLDVMDSLEESSIDFYASLRNLYRQNRESEIHNGKPQFEDLPDFEDDFDDEDDSESDSEDEDF